MSFMDWLALVSTIVAFLAFVVAVSELVIILKQKNKRDELIKALKARSQAAYNSNYNIAELVDEFVETMDKDKPQDVKLKVAERNLRTIRGVVDTTRTDIVAYSREHLNFVPFREHPANPRAL